MDISKIQAEVAKDENGVVVPINQKSGDPYLAIDGTPATVTVVGSESKKYRAARDTISRKMLRGRRARLEPADLTNNRVDMAAAAVIDWHGWESGGKAAPCTPENVRALLFAADHILEQVEAGISEHADFRELLQELVESVRHDARMARKVGKDGASEQAHLRYLAARGHPVALAALEGPEPPAALDYLHDWLLELHGRSGVGMGGMNPLSYGTLANWSRVTGSRPLPLEVEALFYLDAVMLSPDAGDKADG